MKNIKLLLIYLLSLGLLNCNQSGFENTRAPQLPNDPIQTPGDNSNVDPAKPFPSVELNGFISGGSDSGVRAITIDSANKALILTVPLSINPYLELVSIDVIERKGIKATITQNSSGRFFLQLSVPLRYVVRGANLGDPKTLPNGDPLPQVPNGELPSLEISIKKEKKVKMHIYIGSETLAVFIESPFNPYLNALFRIKDEFNIKILGYFALIPEKPGFQGGFFLSSTLPSNISRVLDDYFQN